MACEHQRDAEDDIGQQFGTDVPARGVPAHHQRGPAVNQQHVRDQQIQRFLAGEGWPHGQGVLRPEPTEEAFERENCAERDQMERPEPADATHQEVAELGALGESTSVGMSDHKAAQHEEEEVDEDVAFPHKRAVKEVERDRHMKEHHR